jgi:RPA family protein
MTLVIYALKTSETIQIIDKYIEYRHESVSSSLLLQVEQVKTFLNEANDNVDQKTIKKYMKKLEKSSVWNDK